MFKGMTSNDSYHDKCIDIFSILKWDGGCLGEWSKVEVIRASTRSNPLSVIKFNGITIEVQIYQSTIPYMCLVDEMKNVFNLKKRGTHWFKRGLNSVIITQAYAKAVTLKDFMIQNNYQPVDLQKFQPQLYREILEIYIFRNLCGVKSNNLSSIKIINSSDNYEALSVGEVNSIKSGEMAELPCNILDNYFGEVDPEKMATNIYRRCINSQANDKSTSKSSRYQSYKPIDISIYIGAFNDLIDDITHRIDKRLVHYTSDIKPRFLNTMSSYRGISSFNISGPPSYNK